ncbi:unnamed protein product [Symbiodinium natans]|uniref:Uncharacterized protein n=1 Tax=Symbiodinium natans TaxID=878477 RepID=A0A812I771_9DINO|nr:unnamed protein product [Symbiodinium natans]
MSRVVEDAQLESFFQRCIETMSSEPTRRELANADSGRPGKHLAELQAKIWEELGVPLADGRAAVARIPAPGQAASAEAASLPELKQAYATAMDAAYLQCLEDRRPDVLLKEGKMSRNTVLEFLEACNVKMDTAEVRGKLRQKIEETGALPETVANEVHDEIMELLGFERAYGHTCFAEFGTSQEFAHDKDVATAYARWRGHSSEIMFRLLYDHWQAGGVLHVDATVKHQMMKHGAKVQLNHMSTDERRKLLETSIDKVNVFHKLPHDGRQRYLERLDDQEMLEFTKAEILVATLVQSRQHLQRTE